MKSERFFCRRCHRFFDSLKFYEDKHGLESPPYERVAVCSICESDDFLRFDCFIEKDAVAEKILPVIMRINRYINALKDVLGTGLKNDDLSDGVEMLAELISEMFSFVDVDTERKILKMDNDRELHRIFMCLKGEL